MPPHADAKRVLVVGPTPPPYHGVAVFIRGLLNARPPGWIVEHLDTSDRRDAANLGRWDAGNLTLGFSHLAELASRLLRRRHDLVYVPISQNVPAFLRDALFILSSRLLGARVVVQLHGGYFRTFYERETSAWFRAFARWTLRRASAVVVLSEEFRPIFAGLVDPARIHTVENGVEDSFAGREFGRSKPTAQTLLYLSTLNRTKGILELLGAMAQLRTEFPRLRLRVAGEWSEPAARAEAESLITRENLSTRVEFVGNVDGAGKRAFLESGTLFCLPTHYPYEGQPLVLLEAMSAALPVLSTRHGSIASTVGDTVTGRLAQSGAAAAELAALLRDMLSNPARLDEMGAAGRHRFLERYTLAACHARLFEVFNRAVE